MTRTSRRTFVTLSSAGLVVACTPGAAPAAVEAPAPKVDEHQARTLALKHYQHLAKGLYYRHPVTNELFPFPAMDETQFQFVEAKGDCWLVRAQPLAGWTVIVRVDKGGDWVEVVSWGLVVA